MGGIGRVYCNAIHVKQNVAVELVVDKHARVLLSSGEVFGGQEFSEESIPFVRRLLKSIYASGKFPYFVSVTEPWWRSHVNFVF